MCEPKGGTEELILPINKKLQRALNILRRTKPQETLKFKLTQLHHLPNYTIKIIYAPEVPGWVEQQI